MAKVIIKRIRDFPLKSMRKRVGLSHKELAKLSDVPAVKIKKYETNQLIMTEKTYRRLSKILYKKIDKLSK